MARLETSSTSTAHMIGLWAAGPLAVAAFALSLVFGQADVGFTGANSMLDRLLLVSAFGAPLACFYGWTRIAGDVTGRSRAEWLRMIARTCALVIGALMLVLFAVSVLSQAFVGYVFPWFWGAVTVAAYAFLAGYAFAVVGARDWVGDVIMLAVSIALIGILTAATFSGAENWWETAISALGTSYSLTWRVFDVACVTAGLMLLLASPSVRTALESVPGEVVAGASVRWGPVVTGLVATLLCFVGLFPMDGTDLEFLLHNVGGIGFGVTLFVMMALTSRAFRGIPRAFIWYSWSFVALTALATLAFWPARAFSLAELEVVAFGFEGLWAILLFATLHDLARADTHPRT